MKSKQLNLSPFKLQLRPSLFKLSQLKLSIDNPTEVKPVEAKPVEAQLVEVKPVEIKIVDKPSEVQPAGKPV